MPEFLLTNEPVLRLAAFAGILLGMAGWEVLAPRREQGIGRITRWPNNIGVVVLDTVLVRVAFPMTAVGLAVLAESQDGGCSTGCAYRLGWPSRWR
jgi:hypothetical protein